MGLRVQQRFKVELFVDYIPDLTVGPCQLKDNRVNKRDVVRQEEETALRQMLLTKDADPVKGASNKVSNKIDGALSGHKTNNAI
jgi:hypothetical protein